MKKPKITTLKNGLRVLLIPESEMRTATVLVLVEAGSKYEDRSINGLSHFLEHMCFKGTTKRPSAQGIATELDSIGAEYNAFTGHEYTGYYAKVAHQHLGKALDLVADLYVDPLFLPDDIEREKGVIVGEIDMRNDMLPSRAGELFMSLLYGDQPAGWPIAGPKELVTTFTRDQFIAYRKAHYVASSTIVVVAGKFDPKIVKRDIERSFTKISTGSKKGKKKVDDMPRGERIKVEVKPVDQTHLVIGVRGAKIKHADIPGFTVLSAILGGGMSSRLFQKMRGELGLGYYTHSSHDAYTDHGVFAVGAGVDNTRVIEAVSVICAELTKLTKEEVTQEELQKIKDMASGRLLMGLESSDELAEYFGFQEVLRKEIRSPEDALKRIHAVTTKDIKRIAKKYFTTERLYLALIGPELDRDQLSKAMKIG